VRKSKIHADDGVVNRLIPEIEEEEGIDIYSDKILDSCNVVPKGIFIEFEADWNQVKDSVFHEKKREYSKKL